MGPNGLLDIELSVPEPTELADFWERRGMVRTDDGVLGTDDRPVQLRFAAADYRHLSEIHLSCEAERDLADIARRLGDLGIESRIDDTALTCADPVHGHRVVIDVGAPPPLTIQPSLARNAPGSIDPTHNDAAHRPRRDTTIRLTAGPSHVQRLGHVVVNVIDFRESEAWYKERFGLITSDEIAVDDTKSIGAFMRCDRGPIHVDHHTLFCVGRGSAGFNHAAFEVADFDDLMAGHTRLQNAERQHQWGVGRHILGSQVYDYWRDPYGHMIEHWTDGDLFNSDVAPNVVGVPDLLGSQWGPMLGGPPG